MKTRKILSILLLGLLVSGFTTGLAVFSENDYYKDKFEEVHIKYDESITKFDEKRLEYSFELPLREMMRKFDVVIYPDQKFTYEDSIDLPVKLQYAKTSVGGSGTLKMEGEIVYDPDTGYPSLKGEFNYAADVTEIDEYLEKTDKRERHLETHGVFRLGTPMLEESTSTLSYGGTLTDEDTTRLTTTHYYKDGSTYVETSDSGYFGIVYYLKSEAKLKPEPVQAEAISESDGTQKDVDPAPIYQTENTGASETSGETAVIITTAIVVGAVGAAAGAGAAVAASGASRDSGAGNSEEASGSTYKMNIYKDFGDRIRTGAGEVFVSARMTEINSNGVEVDRPDLTGQIEIFSTEPYLSVGAPSVFGNYMRAAVKANNNKNGKNPSEGIISFKFAGQGGVFQNNVRFKLIGECKIKLNDKKIYLLAASSDSFELEYELVDFADKAEVELVSKSSLFELRTGKNKLGRDVIVAAPTKEAGEKPFERFVYKFGCEISAKNDKESAMEQFDVYLCYEGIGTAYKDCSNNTVKDEIILYCLSDAEKEKREENVSMLPLTVMCWDSSIRRLQPDTAASGCLDLSFKADSNSKNISSASAKKAVDDARITAVVESGTSALITDANLSPTVYKLYPTENAVCEGEFIDLIITAASESHGFKELVLKARLKPQNDFRSMIKWFIEYPEGTLIGRYITLGEIDIYYGALEFIENRVYSMSSAPFSPKTKENHYEDGIGDVVRPNCVVLRDDSMPHKVGEFKKIQSLFHELTHAIEHKNGDIGLISSGGAPERHTYFIQYLSDAVKALADLERNPSADVEEMVQSAILSFNDVFFNPDNCPPQHFDWFGTKYRTQHKIFSDYINFDVFCPTNIILDSQKKRVANAVMKYYFPGDSLGKFKESGGFFKDTVWTFIWGSGWLKELKVVNPNFRLTEMSQRRWMGGKRLALQITLGVESLKDGKTDVLDVELDAGSFDPDDYRYPEISGFTVTWRATDKISDCIMKQPKTISKAEKI